MRGRPGGKRHATWSSTRTHGRHGPGARRGRCAVAGPRDELRDGRLDQRTARSHAEDRAVDRAPARHHRSVVEQRRVAVAPPQILRRPRPSRCPSNRSRLAQQLVDPAFVEHARGAAARSTRRSIDRRPPSRSPRVRRVSGEPDRSAHPHVDRHPPDDLPAHLQVAGQALLVRRVEDEVRLVPQVLERLGG